MEQRDVRFRLLQEMSADFRNRMAENWALRDAVRMSEAAQHCYKQEPYIQQASLRPLGMSCASDLPY